MISIDSDFKDNAKIKELSLKMGDEARAVGNVFIAYRLAQYFLKEHKILIPVVVWYLTNLSELLFDVGIAEKRPDGIYVSDLGGCFSWVDDAKNKC